MIRRSRFSWRPILLATSLMIVLFWGGALFYRLVLASEVDVGSMDGRFSATGVAPGWSGWNRDGTTVDSHRSVPGKHGTAQEISTERAVSRSASISSTPALLQTDGDNYHVLSFWYRRTGKDAFPHSAYVGIGSAQKVRQFVLPPANEWTYVETVVPPIDDQTTLLSFWALEGVTLQVDEVGFRRATQFETEELAETRWTTEGPIAPSTLAPSADSEVEYRQVPRGLFTWKKPGSDIGTMEVGPDIPGVAGGWDPYNQQEVPFSQTHSLVDGRTGGVSQQLSTVGNGVTVTAVSASPSYFQAPGNYRLDFWYRLLVAKASQVVLRVDIMHDPGKTILPALKATTEWQHVEIDLQLDRPGRLIFWITGSDAILQLDDVSLVNQEGLAGVVPIVVPAAHVEVSPAPALAIPSVAPKTRPPLHIHAKEGRYKVLTDQGGFGALLLDSPVLISGFLAGLIGVALLSFPLASGLLGALQGVVAWEPAPVDLLWIIWGLGALATGKAAWGRFRRYPVLTGSIGVFLVGNILSLAGSGPKGWALSYLVITLYCVSLFGSVVTLGKNLRAMEWLRGGLIAAAMLNATVAILSLMGVEPIASMFSQYGRVQGLFKDPNVLGPFLTAGYLLLADVAREEYKFPIRLAITAAELLLITGIVLTQSRAAIATLLLSMIAYWGARTYTHRGLAGVAKLATRVLVLVGVVAVLYQISAVRADRLSMLKEYDSNLRFPVQAAGIKLALSRPLGIGPGGFEQHMPLSAHSLYVRTLTENGWIGFVGLGGVTGFTLWVLWKRVRDSTPLVGGPSFHALLAWWVGVLANSAVIDSIHWRHFWLLLGLIWSQIMRHDEEQEARPHPEVASERAS